MIHLIIVVDPVQDGQELVALCGEKLSKSKAIPLAEFGDNPPLSSVRFCKRCFGRRYFYAVSESGQEAHDLNEFSTD